MRGIDSAIRCFLPILKYSFIMKAWILERITSLQENETPLKLVEMPVPIPKQGELLIKIRACGVCHTELDEIEGRTPPATFPMVLGHQVVGTIVTHCGVRQDLHIGQRVGIAWIHSACGQCEYCQSGFENLCAHFLATGRDVPGGYAEYVTANEHFVYSIPNVFTDAQAAPLLCAGAIGYRSVSLCQVKNGQAIGLTGFGASGHLALKLIQHQFPDCWVAVFARSENEQRFALSLGANWAGDTTDMPPQLLHRIIDTTPVWTPIVHALQVLKPGGRLVINAIGKESSDQHVLQSLDYPRHLWLEKEIKSVANVTAKDVVQFIEIAAQIPFIPTVEEFAFKDANKALMEIKQRKIQGAKVLVV